MPLRSFIIMGLAAIIAAYGSAVTPGAAQLAAKPRPPTLVLGRNHPGKVTALADDGVVVDLRDGGTQVVQFNEIWRIRRAFASDEPSGTSVIDFANNRLFVATGMADLLGNVGKKIPLMKLTAPNGEIVYMAAGKITDISPALPGLHNPSSKSVVGTRDGTQQVLETIDEAKRIAGDARVTQ